MDLLLTDRECCPLCSASAEARVPARDKTLRACGACGLVFVLPADRLSSLALKERYLLHNNRIEDRGYCDFLGRAVAAARPFLKPGSRGLDYGCGPGPVLSRLLESEGFVMTDYDPIFFDRRLDDAYDFIFSTECFEHFESPAREVKRIAALLKPGGILTVMTEIWTAKTDFKKWYYTADPTHVAFYSSRTLDYLARVYGFEQIAGDDRRVFVFQKQRRAGV